MKRGNAYCKILCEFLASRDNMKMIKGTVYTLIIKPVSATRKLRILRVFVVFLLCFIS